MSVKLQSCQVIKLPLARALQICTVVAFLLTPLPWKPFPFITRLRENANADFQAQRLRGHGLNVTFPVQDPGDYPKMQRQCSQNHQAPCSQYQPPHQADHPSVNLPTSGGLERGNGVIFGGRHGFRNPQNYDLQILLGAYYLIHDPRHNTFTSIPVGSTPAPPLSLRAGAAACR